MFKEFNTIEEVDAHLADYDAKNAHKAQAADGTNKSDLCTLYAKWGPVLKFASGLLFFKPAWKKGFIIFIQAIETNCDVVDANV